MAKSFKCKKHGNAFFRICSLFIAVFSLCALSGCFLPINADNSAQEEKGDSTTETAKFSIGETFSADGLNITLQNVEDWNSDNMFITPKEGYKFIRVYFVLENTGSTSRYLSAYDFDCYADNSKMERTIYGDNSLESTDIASGRALQGYIYYEVPVNSQSIEIEYCSGWWNSEKVIFKIK